MLERMLANFEFHATALQLRSERQAMLASNIANADTPNYRARDFDFKATLIKMKGDPGNPSGSSLTSSSGRAALPIAATSAAHISTSAEALVRSGPNRATTTPGYRVEEQASIDGNSVDMDRERANFLDNGLRYESTLRFMNSSIRNMLTAIKGE